MKKGTLTAIIVILLAAIIVLVCGIGSSWFTNGDFATWFNSWGKGTEQEQPADDDTADNGGMVISADGNENMAVTMSAIVKEDFGDYGISASAESAELVTATLEPVDATYTTATWSAAWANAESEWASGKTVTDYVTVTPTADSELSAAVACLQPFGEQITVALTVAGYDALGEEYTVTGSCAVDYAQKITSVSLSFGDVSVDFEHGVTRVPLQVNENGIAEGGAANLSYTTSEVYTLADTFTAVYAFDDYLSNRFCVKSFPGGNISWLQFADQVDYAYDYTAIENYSVSDSGLYFGLAWFADNLGLHRFSGSRSAPLCDEVFTDPSDSASWETQMGYALTNYTDGTYTYSGTHLFDLVVTLTGTYSVYSDSSSIHVGSVVNTVAVSSISLDEDSIIF